MVTRYELDLDDNRHPVMVCEKQYAYESSRIDSVEAAVQMLENCFHAGRKAEEHVYMIALDVKKEALGLFSVSHGQAGMCVISPREILIRALLIGASSIIIAHNHPSGDVSPSVPDLEFASRMIAACKAAGINLDDNLILGDGVYYSFLESGRL